MEKNGKKSCNGISRNIGIHYLFSKNRFESNSFKISYCSIKHMLAGFFTKSLQGSLFAKFRDVVIGWKHEDTLKMGPTSTKERVVNVVKVSSNKE